MQSSKKKKDGFNKNMTLKKGPRGGVKQIPCW